MAEYPYDSEENPSVFASLDRLEDGGDAGSAAGKVRVSQFGMWLSTLFALSNILALVYIKENTILKQADKFPFSAKAAYLQTGYGIQSAVFLHLLVRGLKNAYKPGLK